MAQPLPSLFSGMAEGIPQGAAIGQAMNQMDLARQKEARDVANTKFTQSLNLLASLGKDDPEWAQKIYAEAIVPSAKETLGFDLDPTLPEYGYEAAGTVKKAWDKVMAKEMSLGDFRQFAVSAMAQAKTKHEREQISDILGASGAKEDAAFKNQEKITVLRAKQREIYQGMPLPTLVALREQIARTVREAMPDSPEALDATTKLSAIDEVLNQKGAYGPPKPAGAPAPEAVPTGKKPLSSFRK